MKILLISMFLIVFLIGAGLEPTPAARMAEGRFKIHQCRDANWRGEEYPVILKLDSFTGHTWSYEVIDVYGPTSALQRIYGWVELPERSAATARMLHEEADESLSKVSGSLRLGPQR